MYKHRFPSEAQLAQNAMAEATQLVGASEESCVAGPIRRVSMIRNVIFINLLLVVLGLGIGFSGWLLLFPDSPLQKDVPVSHGKLEARHAWPQQSPESAASFLSISSTSTSTGTVLATATATGVTKVFQVDGPVLGPQGVMMSDGESVNQTGVTGLGGTSCQVTLMEFEFKDSFGKPFVGEWSGAFMALSEGLHGEARG